MPRFLIPGETIFVMVRTIARFYLLRPAPELVEAMKYCLGHYAQRHGIILHAICVMSTDIHLVAFDERGHRSLFLRDVNRGIANVVKALRGWRGPVSLRHLAYAGAARHALRFGACAGICSCFLASMLEGGTRVRLSCCLPSSLPEMKDVSSVQARTDW